MNSSPNSNIETSQCRGRNFLMSQPPHPSTASDTCCTFERNAFTVPLFLLYSFQTFIVLLPTWIPAVPRLQSCTNRPPPTPPAPKKGQTVNDISQSQCWWRKELSDPRLSRCLSRCICRSAHTVTPPRSWRCPGGS